MRFRNRWLAEWKESIPTAIKRFPKRKWKRLCPAWAADPVALVDLVELVDQVAVAVKVAGNLVAIDLLVHRLKTSDCELTAERVADSQPPFFFTLFFTRSFLPAAY